MNYSNEANANCSLLHTAAMSSTNLTRLLVEHGAQVNVQTTQGDTFDVRRGKWETRYRCGPAPGRGGCQYFEQGRKNGQGAGGEIEK